MSVAVEERLLVGGAVKLAVADGDRVDVGALVTEPVFVDVPLVDAVMLAVSLIDAVLLIDAVPLPVLADDADDEPD